jgi:hypothetical protein
MTCSIPLSIREGPRTGYLEVFCSFAQYLRSNRGILAKLWSFKIPSHSSSNSLGLFTFHSIARRYIISNTKNAKQAPINGKNLYSLPEQTLFIGILETLYQLLSSFNVELCMVSWKSYKSLED